MLEKLTKLLIFCSIFLTDYRIFSIPITTIVLLVCTTIIIHILLLYKNSGIKSILLKDHIKKYLFFILALSIFTYVLKVSNAEHIKQLYYNSSGSKPDFLYFKMIMNGIVFILMALLAFSIGLAYKGDNEGIIRIIKFSINLITLNALINVLAWLIQTGGIIGRYNFTLPISSSFGINIQWSILGFILQLSTIKEIKKLSIETFKLIILFLSILIIISRQNQLMFIIIIAIYIYLTSKKNINFKSISFFTMLIASISYIGLSLINITVFDAYKTMLNPRGDDLLVRYNILISAVNIFKENMLIGVGYGMFGGYNTATVAVTSANVYLGSPHNGIIAIVTEMGIIGLILNLILAFKIIRRMNIIRKHEYNNHQNQNKYLIAIYSFISVNIFAALISNYFLFPPASEFSYYGIASFSWLLIGIVLSNEYQKI